MKWKVTRKFAASTVSDITFVQKLTKVLNSFENISRLNKSGVLSRNRKAFQRTYSKTTTGSQN